MSKVVEREKARELRRIGKSIREIQSELGVSKGSISRWVGDIELTEGQIEILRERNPCQNRSGNFGSNGMKEKHKAIRIRFQEQGREDARKNDNLHKMGCMLYWAEGAKNRCQLDFTNSDVDMMKLFVGFLKKCFGVTDEDIALRVACYSDIDTIAAESYWLSKIGLDRKCIRKSTVDCRPRSSKHTGTARRLPFGVCKVRVSSVEVVQRIFGAIQEYGGFTKREWIG